MPELPPDFSRQPCAAGVATENLLICLPGLDAGRTLRDQTPALSDRFEVITMLYGPDDRSSLAEMAARVEMVIRAELAARPNLKLWILGESFGGCLAVIAAGALGPAVERLVLVNPATSFAANPILPLGSPLLTIFPDILFDLAKVVILPFIGDWDRIPPENRDVDRVIASIPQRTTVGRLLQLRAFAEGASERALRRVACPSLVIASGRDRVRDLKPVAWAQLSLSLGLEPGLSWQPGLRVLPSAEEAERLAALLPGCRAVLLPDSGHACLLERGVSLRGILEEQGLLPPAPAPRSRPRGAAAPGDVDVDDGTEDGAIPSSSSSSSASASKPAAALPRAAFRGKTFPAGWEPPTPSDMDGLRDRYGPWKVATDPLYYGLNRVPHADEAQGPILFVGNHTTYGLFDTPMLLLEMYYEKGLLMRSLAHESHWSFEESNGRGLASTFEKFGSNASERPASYRPLARASKTIPVLLFPGGAREVCKRKGEKYQLFWRENTDFVRVAMRHGATVVPFSAVGAEEVFDIALDANEMRSALQSSPLLAQMDARLEEIGVPQGEWFPVPAPGLRLPRLYFRFGEPLDLSGYSRKDLKDAELCSELYGRVRTEVEEGIAWLQDRRAEDPESELAPRLLRQGVTAAAQALFALQDGARRGPGGW
eukprot:tig00020557_g11125.t1